MDRALKLALVKKELLVIGGKHTPVNQYMQRVLTARQAAEVSVTRSPVSLT